MQGSQSNIDLASVAESYTDKLNIKKILVDMNKSKTISLEVGTGTSHSCIESPNVEVNIIRID